METDTIRFAARLNPPQEAPYCKSVNIRIYAAVKTARVRKREREINDNMELKTREIMLRIADCLEREMEANAIRRTNDHVGQKLRSKLA